MWWREGEGEWSSGSEFSSSKIELPCARPLKLPTRDQLFTRSFLEPATAADVAARTGICVLPGRGAGTLVGREEGGAEGEGGWRFGVNEAVTCCPTRRRVDDVYRTAVMS